MYVAASSSFVNQWTVAAGGDVIRDYGRWSANVGRFAGTKRLRSLRRMNAARRWRSDAAAKPHQAPEACINLATTTERKIVCSETSSMPWARKTARSN